MRSCCQTASYQALARVMQPHLSPAASAGAGMAFTVLR